MRYIAYLFNGFDASDGSHILMEDTGNGVEIRVSTQTPVTFTPEDFERFVAEMRSGFERIAEMRGHDDRHPDEEIADRYMQRDPEIIRQLSIFD